MAYTATWRFLRLSLPGGFTCSNAPSVQRAALRFGQNHFSSSSSLPPLRHLPQTCGHLRRAGQLRPACVRSPGRAGVRSASRGAGMETESFLGVSRAVGKGRAGERDARREGCGSPEGLAAGGGGGADPRAIPMSPEGLAGSSSPGTAPHRVSCSSREGFFSFWVGCSICLTDVIVNGSLIISPSRNCVGRGLAVSQRPGLAGLCAGRAPAGTALARDNQPGALVSWGWRMVICSGFTRLHGLLLVYCMCPGIVLKL